MSELLNLAAPRPWSVNVEDDHDNHTVTIVDANGFEVCQLWYNVGDGPTPNQRSSAYDAVVIVEAVNAYAPAGDDVGAVSTPEQVARIQASMHAQIKDFTNGKATEPSGN